MLLVQMENIEQHDRIVALGQRLVEELGLKKRGNTLEQWMAHYVAELIERIKAGSSDQATKHRCAELILDVWSRRSQFPNGNTASTTCLRYALILDKTARGLIDYCIRAAALEGLDKTREWSDLAEGVGVDSDIERIRIFLDRIYNGPSLDEAKIKHLDRLLESLDLFTDIAGAIRDDIRAEYKKLSSDIE
jgi:hypothetical protein